MAWSAQPLDRVPPININADLRGCWLCKGLEEQDLGADFSPAGDNMTPVNGPRRERVGAHFTAASSQYLRRAEADWRSGDSLGTVLAWIKLDSTGVNQTIFCSADNNATGNNFLWRINTNDLLQVTDGTGPDFVVGSTVFVADRWYRVVLTSSGTAWSMYVNGTAETLTPGGGGNTGAWLADIALRDDVTIGAQVRAVAALFMDGTIKDVGYENRELSADEILLDYRLGVPDDDLVFWSEGGMTDLSRYGHALTRVANTIGGHQMTFDGTGDWITLPAAVSTYLNDDDDYTISMWLRTTTLVSNQMAFDSVTGLNDRMGIYFDAATDEIRVSYYDGGYTSRSQALTAADLWTHIVMVKSGAAVIGYLNAAAFTGANDPGFTANVACRIGARNDGAAGWNGSIRDLRIFSTAKSADWVANLYERTRRSY